MYLSILSLFVKAYAAYPRIPAPAKPTAAVVTITVPAATQARVVAPIPPIPLAVANEPLTILIHQVLMLKFFKPNNFNNCTIT